MTSSTKYSSLADVPPDNPWKQLAETRYSAYRSTLYMDPEKLREVAQMFDEDDRVLQLLLLSMRAARNVICSPITILPNEVLSLIFEFLCFSDPPRPPRRLRKYEDDPDDDEFDSELERVTWGATDPLGSLGWYKVSHVSRRWRHCALKLSELWAAHVGLLPCASETVLNRCGAQRPIAIHVKEARWSLYRTVQIWDTLMRLHNDHAHPFNLSRICSLHTLDTSFFNNHEKPSDGFLEHELSCVEEVRLQGITGCVCHWDQPSTSEEWQELHPTLITPRLRRLYFENTFLPFKATDITNISLLRTNFEGDIDHIYHQCVIPASVFMAALRQVRRSLQFLEITLFIPDLSRLEPEEVLELPNLHELRLCDLAKNLAAFFSVVTFPDTTRLNVSIALDVQNKIPQEAVSVLRTAISCIQNCGSPKGLFIQSSSGPIYAENVYAFAVYPSVAWEKIAASRSDAPSDGPFACVTPPLTLGITSTSHPTVSKPPHHGRIITTIAEALDLTQIEVLSLHLNKWGPSTIRDTLDHFTGLRILHVHNPIPPDRSLTDGLPSFPYLPPHPSTSNPVDSMSQEASRIPLLSVLWISQELPASNPAIDTLEVAGFVESGFSVAASSIQELGLEWHTPVQRLRVDCIRSGSGREGRAAVPGFKTRSLQHLVPPVTEWRVYE